MDKQASSNHNILQRTPLRVEYVCFIPVLECHESGNNRAPNQNSRSWL